MSLFSKIETILFVASKPISLKKIIKVTNASEEDVQQALGILIEKYNQDDSGIVILINQNEYQMVSSAENKEIAEQFLKAEISGELTRPQLESLTVISYCGPITKPELEQIRGVNCSLILRNLLMRGLIKENSNANSLLPTYEVTMDYLRHLGINSLADLPDYDTLHNHEYITHIFSENELENPNNLETEK